jgi:hypothetical protein
MLINVSRFTGRGSSRGTTNALDIEFDHYIETGFQLATLQGPLCAEPMQGMAFLLESVQIDSEGIEKERGSNPNHVFLEIGLISVRAKPAGPNHRFPHLFCARSLSERAIRLFTAPEAGHVL